MPRVGEPISVKTVYPWKEWEALLKQSPTKTLYFEKGSDFTCTVESFRKLAWVAFSDIGATTARRGSSVVVQLNA